MLKLIFLTDILIHSFYKKTFLSFFGIWLFAFCVLPPTYSKRPPQDKDSLIKQLLVQSETHLKDSVELAIKFANDAEQLAKTSNNLHNQGLALFFKAQAYESKEEYKKSIELYSRALLLFNQTNDSVFMAKVWFNRALIEYYTGNYNIAIEDYYNALKHYHAVNDQFTLAKIYQNLGMVYYDMNNLNRSLEYYELALEINKDLKKTTNIAGLEQNIGLVYYEKADYATALKYLEKSRETFTSIEDNEGLASVLSNLGLIYETQKKYDQALSYYNQAYQIFIKINYRRGMAFLLYNLGSIHQNLKHNNTAIAFYNQSLILSQELNIRENVIDIYKTLSGFYETQNNYGKALSYFKKYSIMRDSLYNQENKTRLEEMESRFELQIKEQELAKKNAELAYQKNFIYIMLVTLLVVLVLVIVIAIASHQRRTVQKELEINKTKLEALLEKQSAELRIEITERQIAEESDRLKSAFLANMSHEIRTPMNAIIAFSNFLKDKDLEDEQRNEFINYINVCGSNLLQIIEDIIDTAKIEAKQLKINKAKCNVNQVLAELYNLYSATKATKGKRHIELRINNEILNRSCYVLTDVIRLRQIMTNLLDNAMKFTDLGYIEFGFVDKYNSFLEFYVRDTGKGIPSDKHTFIFERFGQVEDHLSKKYGGTGLGLNISKSLVEILGGRIWVESILGVGSTFYFTLPYNHIEKIGKSPEKLNNHLNSFKENYHWDEKTILVAEDEELNFKVIETALKKTKVKIIRAKDGHQAIDYCKAYDKIDLILMDIQMPGMDGYEATRNIKTFRNDVPIIAQTAYALVGEKEKCLAAGCDDYLSKPIIIDDLLSKLSIFLTTV